MNSGGGANTISRRKFLQVSGLGVVAIFGMHRQAPSQTAKPSLQGGGTMYIAKDYSKLIGMEGFSETLLRNHFTLYQGYVTNTNKILELLAQMMKEDKASTPEWAELKRRMGWEFNGMRLHEYYFENLGGKTPFKKDGETGEEAR